VVFVYIFAADAHGVAGGAFDGKAVHEPPVLLRCDLPGFFRGARPLEAASGGKSFVEKTGAIAFLSEYSDKKAYPQPFVIRIYFENSLSLTVLQVLFSPKYSDKNP
jgi:hypothetical protein